MPPTELNNMPEGFTLCACNDCERHEACLHWIAYKEHPQRERANFYDPRRFDENGGTAACNNYADSAPVKYAIGFEHIFDEMPKAIRPYLLARLLHSH